MLQATLLEGIKIVDFSRLLPGPLATKLLQRQGAKVFKVELGEKGDWLKFYPPNAGGHSPYYQELNDGKDVIRMDPDLQSSIDHVKQLIQAADIVVEQFRPGVMDGLGFGYQHCKNLKHDLIYISLTGYGQHTALCDRPGHDINFLAESGVLDLLKDSHGQPILPAVQIADIAGGTLGVTNACFAGLYHRAKTGLGIQLDVSIMEGLEPFLVFGKINDMKNGMHENFLSGGLVNYNIYKASDDQYLALGALEIKFWNKFCSLIGQEHWKREHLIQLTTEKFDKQAVVDLFESKPAAYWSKLAMEHDICLSLIAKNPVVTTQAFSKPTCIL